MERLTKDEKKALKNLAQFINEIAEHEGHLYDKSTIFRNASTFCNCLPMLKGYGHLSELKQELHNLTG